MSEKAVTECVRIEATPDAKPGRFVVRAWFAGRVAHMHSFDLKSATSRKQFAGASMRAAFPNQGADDWPEGERERVEEQLLALANVPPGLPAIAAAAGSGDEDPRQAELEKMPPEVRAEAEKLLRNPQLADEVSEAVMAQGVVGEIDLALTVYLIASSRLLTKPLAGIVRGSSASGKTYAVEQVATLFPPECVIHATQMTPQALFHMPPGSLRHKWIKAGERSRNEDDDAAEATRALREMISTGSLTKLMPVKGDGGRIETTSIVQAGPIAFTETTTLTKIFEEDANRCLLLATDERSEQTERIVMSLARRHSVAGDRSEKANRLRAVHHALQRMLPLAAEVRVPFADRIGEKLDYKRVEVRRAFPQLLALVQTSALLHFRQRAIGPDGSILATSADYELARRLIARSFSLSLGGGVSEAAIRLFEELKSWGGAPLDGGFNAREVVARMKKPKSSVGGWIAELREVGSIDVLEQARGRAAARYRLTAKEPSGGTDVIPEVHEVFPTQSHGHNAKTPQL